jgi:hypothetical protein
MKSYIFWYMILGIIPNYEELHLLVYNVLSVESQPTFRRNMSPPSTYRVRYELDVFLLGLLNPLFCMEFLCTLHVSYTT